jgi:hypothetical protein
MPLLRSILMTFIVSLVSTLRSWAISWRSVSSMGMPELFRLHESLLACGAADCATVAAYASGTAQ